MALRLSLTGRGIGIAPLRFSARRRETRFSSHVTPTLPSQSKYPKGGQELPDGSQFFQQPVVSYAGPEVLRAAYVLYRQPMVIFDKHPLDYEFQEMWQSERTHYSRNDDFLEPHLKKHLSKEEFAHWRSKDSLRTEWRTRQKFLQSVTLPNFKPGSRITSSDLEGDSQSVNRALDRRLYCIVQNDETGLWQFPSSLRQPGETMRAAAERLVYDHHGRKLETFFPSDMPIGHWADTDVQDKQDLTFFLSCIYVAGRPSFAEMRGVRDHRWVTRQELRDYEFPNAIYRRTVWDMLWDGYEPISIPPPATE